eukprot:SM000005S17248  [mRNA]  locus=s5:1033306:1036609:+ [translate_table: standard]
MDATTMDIGGGSPPPDSALRMLEAFHEYAAILTAEGTAAQTKVRLGALSVYVEMQGLKGPAALDGLRLLEAELRAELVQPEQFARFYRFVFFVSREQGQKSLSKATALEAWKLALRGRFGLLDRWCTFVQYHQRHAISEDTWRQVLEFSRHCEDSLHSYDPDGAWPVLIDDFMECMNTCCCCQQAHLLEQGLSLEDVEVAASAGRMAGQGSSYGAGDVLYWHPSDDSPRGSKRRWKEVQEDSLLSINSVMQRLAELPTHASSAAAKRLRTSQHHNRNLLGLDPSGSNLQSSTSLPEAEAVLAGGDGLAKATTTTAAAGAALGAQFPPAMTSARFAQSPSTPPLQLQMAAYQTHHLASFPAPTPGAAGNISCHQPPFS